MNNCRTITLLALTASILLGSSAAEAQYPGGRVPVRDPDHFIMRKVWSWQELRAHNIVLQSRDYSCGAAALATIVRYYLGDPVTEDYFLNNLDDLLTPAEVVDRIQNGLALSDLRRVADKTGYEAVVVRLNFEKLADSKVPLLVGIDEDGYKHFVVYRGTNFRWVYLADPIRGHIRMTPNHFQKVWQKNLALAVSKPGEDVPRVHGLSLTKGDLFWGETQDQYIRTLPERGSANQPRSIRN